MDKKKHKKVILYIQSLKKRAERLRKDADDWEVSPRLNKRMKKIGVLLEFFKKDKLSEKEEKKLLGLTKRKLSLFNRHFSSICRVIQKNPMIWSKKIRDSEKELEKTLALYEKITPLLFQKKTKKPKTKN